ncbi:hypothetical protein K458DRAFT_492813 [Lentithecium fluviatile CBS 122367]|uniref:Uncharacterized protein n=1 Tax=Lentithecium fluviatile CBS 122367 TaxID=1168545 RepID=A0A6G1IC82_9PLEO|nr:hypothetical protein K458DRAFT_492813 [Lentithecium fluviatile CBS 122367]
MLEVISDTKSAMGAARTETEVKKRSEALEPAVDNLTHFIAKNDDDLRKAADMSLDFLKQSIDKDQAIDVEIEHSWCPERRRAAEGVLQDLRQDRDNFPPNIVAEVLDEFKQRSDDPTPISAIHHNLQFNVSAFAKMLTGKKPTGYADAIQSLRRVSGERRQWKFLFDELERLRAEIAYHKQIIACLEYRHVLESLPNKESIKKKFNLTQLTTATPAWS